MVNIKASSKLYKKKYKPFRFYKYKKKIKSYRSLFENVTFLNYYYYCYNYYYFIVRSLINDCTGYCCLKY